MRFSEHFGACRVRPSTRVAICTACKAWRKSICSKPVSPMRACDPTSCFKRKHRSMLVSWACGILGYLSLQVQAYSLLKHVETIAFSSRWYNDAAPKTSAGRTCRRKTMARLACIPKVTSQNLCGSYCFLQCHGWNLILLQALDFVRHVRGLWYLLTLWKW